MKRPFSFHFNQQKTIVSLFGLAFFFLLTISGCRGGGEEEAPPPAEGEAPPAVQQGILVCSETCAAKGQCGTIANSDQTVILGHPDHPAVQDHQMTFPAESLPILNTTEATIELLATSEQSNQTFFQVKRADERTGWIAGWCINPQ